jgi:hypothetical protein
VKKALILSVALLASAGAASLWADAAGFSVEGRVDWKGSVFELAVTHTLDATIPALPRAKADAESDIEDAFMGLLVPALSVIPADAAQSYGDIAAADPRVFAWVQGLGRDARAMELALSEDFSRVTARYRFPLFGEHGLAAPLYPAHDAPIRERPAYVPSREYSGLLIYAAEPVPAVGTGREAAAAPALFPRLLDEAMTVILDRGMVRAEALSARGMVGCADGIDENEILRRVGLHPLRVRARAVFGKNRADLVIPTDAARQLLARPENIELLKEAKILVIYQSLTPAR